MDTAATLDQYTQDISNLPAELQHLLAELGTNDAGLYEIRKKVSQKDSAIHKFIKQHGSLTKNPKENQLYPKIREDFKKAEQLQKEKCVVANTALFLTSKHFIKLEADMEKLRDEGLLVFDDLDIDLDQELFSSRNVSRAGTVALPNPILPIKTTTVTNSASVTPMIPTQPIPKKQQKKAIVTKSTTPSAPINGRPMKRQRIDDSKSPEPTPDIIESVPTIKLKSPKAPDNLGSLPNGLDTSTMSAGGNEEENELYCFCQRVSFGNMVGCDNDDCKFEWFHYECVGLKEPPKGKWYCSDCTERLKARSENKKKRRA